MSEKELIQQDLNAKALEQQQKQLRNLEHYHWLKENGYVIFETITGSQAHGTNTPTSDIDKAFVYILPEDDILGIKYEEQLKIHKDFMGYEIRRFLELLRKNNPTVMELLYSPKDCVIIQHPAFKRLIDVRDRFITKICSDSFYGYAVQQRSKAEGLEKLQNWEIQRVTKKNPIDFCYIPQGYDSIPATKWLDDNGYDQLFCALTHVSHCKDLFAVFYDQAAHDCFSERISEVDRAVNKALRKERGQSMGLGYKGIAFEDSTDIRLSNIPMEERKNSICHLSYSKDSYTKHCKDYNRYQKWLEDRNEARWVEIEGHGQKIDGKNMMHFMRLIHIGKEIAEGKGINIRRPDAEELLKIRRGEVSLQELFDRSDVLLAEMKELFKTSNLPDEVSNEMIHGLLVEIRKDFYNHKKGTLGFMRQTVFNREMINTEETNSFLIKVYGKNSELEDFISKDVIEKCGEHHMGEFVEEQGVHIITNALVWNSQMWPNTVNEKTGKVEKAKLDKLSVLRYGRNKITMNSVGENQKPIQFDIVYWQDCVAAINVKIVSEFKEGMAEEYILKALGFKSWKEQ